MSWMKTKLAARHLDISPRTLRKLVKRGDLTPSVIGIGFHFSEAELDRYMETKKCASVVDKLTDSIIKEFKINIGSSR